MLAARGQCGGHELVTSPEAKKWFDTLMLAFGDFDKETGKFTANTEKMKVALGLLGTYVATSWVKKILDAFGGIGTGWKALLALFGIATPVGVGLATAGAGALAGAATAEEMPKVLAERGAGGIDPATGGAMDENGFSGLGSLMRRAYRAVKQGFGLGGGSGARAIGKLAQTDNVKAIVGELRGAGYSENAIAAVVGSMQTESTFNPRAANNQNGGHTGLWQWDSQRWPKVKAWIAAQGGDPYNAAWQTKAWIAEHNAKPDERIYDNRKTEQGGAILRNNPSLEDAITGVQMSERFGRGEEGGRAANAWNWLPQLPKAPTSAVAAGTPAVPAVSAASDAPSRPAAPVAAASGAPALPVRKPITLEDVIPGSTDWRKAGFPLQIPQHVISPAAPSMSSADYSRSTVIHVKQGDVSVRGVDDGKRTAEHIGMVQGYHNSDLIRNLRSSLA